MSAKRKRARERMRRELLFCNTQPVTGGWLTSTVLLELTFTADKDWRTHVGMEKPSDNEVQTRERGVGSDDPRLGKDERSEDSVHIFPGDTFRDPQEDPDWFASTEADAYPPAEEVK